MSRRIKLSIHSQKCKKNRNGQCTQDFSGQDRDMTQDDRDETLGVQDKTKTLQLRSGYLGCDVYHNH